MNMRKRLAGALALIMLLNPCLPVRIHADTTLLHASVPAEASENGAVAAAVTEIASGTCGEKLVWVLTENGVLTISGTGAMADYGWGDSAAPWYHNRNKITSVVVEDGVTTIGYGAFYRCEQLTSVTLPSGLTEIGSYAFHHCESLTEIALPSGVTSLGDYTFYCSRLTSVKIPAGVTEIGEWTFALCADLTDVDIPAHVTDIGTGAFYSCDRLESITLPSGLTHLGSYAFDSCRALTGIDIPSGVTSINDYTFCDCNRLEHITLPSGLTGIGNDAFRYCTSLKSIDLPSGVTTIGDEAFRSCVRLTSIALPSALNCIGDCAFRGCTGLTDVAFAGNAPWMDEDAFYGVIAAVSYPAENATWTDAVKQNYGGTLTWSAVCPGHDYEKGTCTICGAEAPDYVAAIIASGWSGNTTWTLNELGVLTFSGSGNMKNYDYNGGQPWQSYADQITAVVIENGVTAIGEGAFKDLTKLESVTLPTTGLTKIGEAAFYGCTALKEITIPEGIYTIWAYTFKGCTSLSKVKLPKTLIKIDQGAFENCTALTYIYFPTNVEIIGAWSFKGCTALEEAEMTHADAAEIREGAFKNCSSLATIHLPEKIQTLGDSCFYGIGAASFTVPDTVTGVGAWCFARAKLTKIIFEGNALAIGEGAFNKITMTALYDASASGWTEDVMQNYGGTVTWKKTSESSVGKAPFYGLDTQILKQQPYVGTNRIPGTTQWKATIEGDIITDQFGDQVRFVEKMTGFCTAYYTAGEITSLGYPCQYGIVAVNPKIIPYGTRMFICSEDGTFVYGYCVAGDTGGFIYNSNTLIDLRYNSGPQCWEFFGRRNLCVYILE